MNDYLLRFAARVNSNEYSTGLPEVRGDSTQVNAIVQIAIGTLAALSVLMIVIAGFRLIVGQGSPQETAKAKNTIIYAIAGLLVAFCAQAIVTLALDKL